MLKSYTLKSHFLLGIENSHCNFWIFFNFKLSRFRSESLRKSCNQNLEKCQIKVGAIFTKISAIVIIFRKKGLCYDIISYYCMYYVVFFTFWDLCPRYISEKEEWCNWKYLFRRYWPLKTVFLNLCNFSKDDIVKNVVLKCDF